MHEESDHIQQLQIMAPDGTPSGTDWLLAPPMSLINTGYLR